MGKPLAESTPQKLSTQGSGNGEFVSPVLNSISTAPKDAKFSDIPVGQLVDIPLEGAGESLYEASKTLCTQNMITIKINSVLSIGGRFSEHFFFNMIVWVKLSFG